MRQDPAQNAKTLNSWKEVANYLRRGVLTVQRWAAELQLPVHRMGASERGPVFAFRAEVDNWLRKQGGAENQDLPAPKLTKPDRVGSSLSALDRSARLTSKALQLIEKQQEHTRLITQQLERMYHLLPDIRKIGLTASEIHEHSDSMALPRLSSAGRKRKVLRVHSAENS